MSIGQRFERPSSPQPVRFVDSRVNDLSQVLQVRQVEFLDHREGGRQEVVLRDAAVRWATGAAVGSVAAWSHHRTWVGKRRRAW